MKILETKLPGVLIVEPKVFRDPRGCFLETFHADRYANAGLPARFCQDNVSFSRRGVLRGLHFQNPNQQGKLVHVLDGEVFDVAVDIRERSPSFGQWVGIYLSSENRRQLYVPPGFAHGFCVTSDSAIFAYSCTAPYDPSAEHSIRWDDPQVGVEWPVDTPVLSEKDEQAPPLQQLVGSYLPVHEVDGPSTTDLPAIVFAHPQG